MNSLLNTKEICQQIFSLDTNNNDIPSDLPEDTVKFIQQLINNIPDESLIHKALKELKTEEIDVVMNELKISVQYNNLEKIFKDKNIFDKVFKIFSLYTFYAWIGMNPLLFKKEKNINLYILLEVLNLIIQKSKKIPEWSQYSTISISCFVDIIKTAAKNDCIENYDQIFGVISEFFLENQQLPIHSDEIIKIIADKIIAFDGELSNTSIALVSSVTLILQQNPLILSQTVIFSVLRSVQSHIINLDLFCLKLFLNAANYIKTDDFIKIFKPMMIQTLTNVVRNHEDFYNKEKENNETGNTDTEKNAKKVEVKLDDDYFHPPRDLYQIDKVKDSNLTIQFKVKNLSDFISPKLSQIISTIEEIIILKEEYAQYFLSESIKDLQTLDSSIDLYKSKNLDEEEILVSKRVFFEQCTIIFYLISSAIKKHPNITIQDQKGLTCPLFNNKHIFDPNVTYFNDNKNPNFDIIDSLRQFTFQFLLEKFQESLNEILLENMVYLDLFRECICRLIYIQNNENENNKNQLPRSVSFSDKDNIQKEEDIDEDSLQKRQQFNYRFCSISDTLIKLFVAYRIISEPNEDTNLILIIRKTLLIYFNSFLSYDYILKIVFVSSVFLNNFFTLLMEPPIRQQFIGFLLKYLSSFNLNEKFNYQKEKSQNNSVLPELCQCIISLFNVSCKEMPQDEALSLLSDVLNSLNEALIFNKSLTFIFEPIASDLCHNIMSINIESGETEHMEDLLLSLISFLAATSHDKTIKANDISLLESTIIHLTKTKPQSKIMQKLVQIIAGKQISFILPTFEIKQSKVLCSFVRIFLETNHVYKVLKFISDLCSYSSENCIKCHDGELDLLLIDIITKWRKTIIEVIPEKQEPSTANTTQEIDLNTNYFNDIKNDDSDIVIKYDSEKNGLIISEKLIDLFLNLLAQIAAVVSSVSVVQRFFSMLCPIDAKYLSPIHKNIINSLNKILLDSRYFPLAALPMLPSSKIEIHNTPMNSFEKGLSFVFWISMPSTLPDDFAHNIAVIDDGRRHKFKVKIKGKVLRVKIQSGSDFYHYDFALNLPIKTWTMITITTIPNPNNTESSVALYVNKEQVKLILKFALFSPKATIGCIINNNKKSPKDKNFDPPLMGPFILSQQLLPEDIVALSDEGPRPTLSSCSEKIVFAFTPQYCGKYFSFLPLLKSEEIVETHQQIVSRKKSLSFLDLIMNYCKVYLILPIFGQLDIPLKDGSLFPFMADLGVEILANLFYLGEQVQYSFFTYNSFFAIAHLLQNSDKSHITFNLYMRYFNLLGMISYKNLQMQLIDAILLNFDLWSRSEIKHQVRIFKHWSRTVYIPFKYMIDLIRPSEWFIFIMHFYFYYFSSLDEEKILFECRKSLIEIVRESLKTNISATQISIIIQLIIANDSSLIEKKEMIDLLFFILQYDKSVSNTDINISAILENVFTVLDFPEKDDDLVCKIISLFISTYEQKKYEIHISFANYVQLFIMNLFVEQKYLLGEDFFTALISIMNSNKAIELLPFLCMNAILGGTNYLKIFLNEIDRKLDFSAASQSAIYSSLLLFAFSNNDSYGKIINFNIDLFENNWESLINAITTVGYSFFDPDTTDNVKHDILYRISKKDNMARDEIYNLLRQIKNFIFFRLENSESSIFNHLISTNTFIFEYFINQTKKDEIKPNSDDKSENSTQSIDSNDKMIGSASDTDSSLLESDLSYVSGEFNATENSIPDAADKILDSIRNMKENISTKMVKYETSNKLYELKYKYGLRFSKNSDKWLDLDLAKKALQLYANNQIGQFNDIMMCLAHFVYKNGIRTNNDKDKSYIKRICKKMSNDFSFYPKLLEYIYMNDKAINSDDIEKIETILSIEDNTLNYEILIYADKFLKFLNSFTYDDLIADMKKMEELRNSYYENQLGEFINNRENTIKQNRKIWLHLWRSLTITRAPWADSLPKVTQEGFKRDNSFCFAYCPYKVRKIRKFDIHKKASLIRDIGDKKKAQRVLESITVKQPKSLLFHASQKGGATASQDKFVRLENLEELKCKLVTIKGEKDALIKINNKTLIITTFSPEKKIKVIASDSIHSLFYVYKYHQYSGIQIYTKTRENLFLIFSGHLFRSLAIRIYSCPLVNQERIQCKNPVELIASSSVPDRWADGSISNFEYLMYLNILSGRSFNDATQYPIFPWVLKDYKSSELDLDSESVYRDLSKPVGALDNQRLEELLIRWEEIIGIEKKPYLYGSGYSNPLSVYLWLIRLEPFTTQHIDIQGGKFDYAARIFRSIGDSYINATTTQNDFRELIPEFYFLPEFLKNISKFDLGKTDDGDVGDVILPPWAKGSAMEFIYLHRKALESEYVSSHLNEWIDLIWGYKQDGEEAIKANNVFRAEMYETIWKDHSLDDKEIRAIQSNVGQIPLKLFSQKHQKRNFRTKSFVKKSSIKYFEYPLNAIPLSSSSSSSVTTCATTMDSISATVSSSTSIQSYSSQGLNYNMKEEIPSISNSINSNIHHSILKFFEVSSMASADVTLLQMKNKLMFTLLDNKGNIYIYSVDFTLLKPQKVTIKSKSSKKIKNDMDQIKTNANISISGSMGGIKIARNISRNKLTKVSFEETDKESIPSISSPMFIDNKRLCFVDKNSSSVKIVNCTSGVVEKSIEHTFGIVAIETETEGWLAISAKDAAVTVYNVNHLPTSKTTLTAETATTLPIEKETTNLRSRFDFSKASSNSEDVVYSGTISSFRESVKCIAINPTFDALICGTRDNWLLFCRLNVLKMNINTMVETDGRPQNIIVSDVFGFVAVSVTKIENGDLMEKLVLYSINGEFIRSTQWDSKRRIVAMTKASSLPGAFDFLIVADDSNYIYVFEAYYLQFGDPIFKCNSKIKKLTYIKEESLIIAFCEDGTAAVIYKPIIL